MATAAKRRRLTKLSETELLMLFNVALYEAEFRAVNEIERRPFTWSQDGYILNQDERDIIDELDMIPWNTECYRFDCAFSNWMQSSRCRSKLEAHKYLQLNRVDRKVMLFRVTPAGEEWLRSKTTELEELGKQTYDAAKENAEFVHEWGPDPAWVRENKLSLMNARQLVTDLSKWMRSMDSHQPEEVAKLADRLAKAVR